MCSELEMKIRMVKHFSQIFHPFCYVVCGCFPDPQSSMLFLCKKYPTQEHNKNCCKLPHGRHQTTIKTLLTCIYNLGQDRYLLEDAFCIQTAVYYVFLYKDFTPGYSGKSFLTQHENLCLFLEM